MPWKLGAAVILSVIGSQAGNTGTQEKQEKLVIKYKAMTSAGTRHVLMSDTKRKFSNYEFSQSIMQPVVEYEGDTARSVTSF